MKTRRWIFFTAGAVALGVAGLVGSACATNDDSSAPSATDDAASDGSVIFDAPVDSVADAAAPCSDCEDFPATCTDDVLCPTNGPFDPTNPAVGMDWRTRIHAIEGRSPSDIWVAGSYGAAAHFDGTSWSISDLGTLETQHALWLRTPGEVMLGTLGTLCTRDLGLDAGTDASPGGWVEQGTTLTGESPPRQLTSCWSMPGAKYLWCTAAAPIGFIDSQAGLVRMQIDADAGTFDVDDGLPAHFCISSVCTEMWSVHGISADSLWTVGANGFAFHLMNAESDTRTAKMFDTQTISTLRGVWMVSETEAFAVGVSGTIRHYTGDPIRWDVVNQSLTNADFNAVTGASASDVWVVGNAGVVLHYDGRGWSRIKIAGMGKRRPDLLSIWSAGPGHVWIGGEGVVLTLGGKP